MRTTLIAASAAILIGMGSSEALAAPMVVACGRGQHAIVREAFVRGEPVTRVACVGGANRSLVYRTHDVRYRVARRHRSWGKSALIIGGGAGTGAGIGGLVHGKKGALIGAALGGGAASLYEGAHRR